MTRRANFRQADATRAFRAAVEAGLQPKSCTFGPDGSIKVEFADAAGVDHHNPLDRVLQR